MTDTRRRSRKLLIAVMAAIASAAIVVPLLLGLLTPQLSRQSEAPTAPTTTTAPLTIKPLPVRPVISAFVTTPEQCPPDGPVPSAGPAPQTGPVPTVGPTPQAEPSPPDETLRICDVKKTAVYELGPEALRVQLTNVDSFLNPLTGVELVQMTMTPESAKEFGAFTAGQVGKQVAFVRDGMVVWGPKIAAPIDGQVLQLSGELTAEEAEQIAAMLRDKS